MEKKTKNSVTDVEMIQVWIVVACHRSNGRGSVFSKAALEMGTGAWITPHQRLDL